MAHKKTGWELDKDTANFTSASFSARIETKYPDKGVHDIHFDGKPLSDISPLRLSPEPPTPASGETVIESYVRGDDLIITYAQLPSRTSRPQVYWSSLSLDGAVGIQATISMQTSLLDSDPTIRTYSHLGSGELLQYSGAGEEWKSLTAGDSVDAETTSLFLFRPKDADWSYAEVLFPTDFQGAKISAAKDSDNGIEIEFSLFPEFLEKGVIRRGRLQALFMPRADDERLAIAAHQSLASSPAPLTT